MSLLPKLIRAVVPGEVQAPPNVFKELLVRTGYYKLRTGLAAHGLTVPDANLYRPLFSPWDGDPDFEKDYQAIKHHTLCSRDRCYILKTSLSQALKNAGNVIECGVFRGGTALLAARVINADPVARLEKKLHLFDTFTGIPPSKGGIDRLQAGDLGRTSEAQVATLLKDFPFVHIHAGLIPATFADLDVNQVCWAHVDVDIYQSVHDCIEFIYPKITPGGFMLFDDYGFPSCPGARRAVDEAFASRSEVPICLPTGQCLIIKLPS
jgi:O-methyltransferase